MENTNTVLEEKLLRSHSISVLAYNELSYEWIETDHTGIAITYAKIEKDREVVLNPLFIDMEEDLYSGKTLLDTLKKQGYATRENILDVYITALPEWMQELFCVAGQYAKVVKTEILARKHDQVFIYGTMTRVYSPCYKKAEVSREDKISISYSSQVLKQLGFYDEEIWALADW